MRLWGIVGSPASLGQGFGRKPGPSKPTGLSWIPIRPSWRSETFSDQSERGHSGTHPRTFVAARAICQYSLSGKLRAKSWSRLTHLAGCSRTCWVGWRALGPRTTEQKKDSMRLFWSSAFCWRKYTFPGAAPPLLALAGVPLVLGPLCSCCKSHQPLKAKASLDDSQPLVCLSLVPRKLRTAPPQPGFQSPPGALTPGLREGSNQSGARDSPGKRLGSLPPVRIAQRLKTGARGIFPSPPMAHPTDGTPKRPNL